MFDEHPDFSSCTMPTAKQLWKPSLGVLHLEVLGARDLLPMTLEGGITNPYCVAKYGEKWFRTSTITENLNPEWKEQYSWEVYDACTVLTVGVFDNK